MWREAYQQFKTKKGVRSSIEALLKRIEQGKGVGSINPLVDIYNAANLTHGLPCGAEDIDTFAGSLKLLELDDKGTVAEEYALTPESEPFTARPDMAYRLAQVSDDVCMRLHYLCEPAHFFQIRHGMTPAHSEVVAAVEKFGVAPCKTLDMGAGQGRNALYLALKGFDVTAVDINAGALANAAQVAAQENLSVATELYDLNLAALHDEPKLRRRNRCGSLFLRIRILRFYSNKIKKRKGKKRPEQALPFYLKAEKNCTDISFFPHVHLITVRKK